MTSRPAEVSLGPDERVLLECRSDPADVPLSAIGFAIITLTIGIIFWWLAGLPRTTMTRAGVAGVIVAVLGVRLAWGEIVRRCRRYTLTDRRLIARSGVFRRHLSVVPLDRVQHSVVSIRFRDRVAGIGTVGVSTAGTGFIEIIWIGVRRPRAVLAEIETAVAAARAEASRSAATSLD